LTDNLYPTAAPRNLCVPAHEDCLTDHPSGSRGHARIIPGLLSDHSFDHYPDHPLDRYLDREAKPCVLCENEPRDALQWAIEAD